MADKTDCDDTDAAVSPAEPEQCNGVDDDCDSSVDEDDAIDPTTWYADADEDGFGDPTDSVESCDAPTGYLADATDCDDGDPTVNSDATEGAGDEVDQDCDGAETCYADLDQDGYAAATGATTGSTDVDCDDARELDRYAPGGDCDDGDPAYHPSADESACTADFNCDGHVGTTDTDGDGYVSCQDCDDADDTIKPGATEVCDDQDNDCDGLVDDEDTVDAATTSTWYADADEDGYGDATSSVATCDPPEGYGADDTDCDDADGGVYPGAIEGVADALDQDCDGWEDCYADADADGYASHDGATVSSADLDCDGSGEADDTAPRTDCDDARAGVHPGAADDSCDTVDWDCNGYDGDLAVDNDDTTYTGALTSVQDALDALTGGELVCVAPGTYRENLFVADVEFELVALSCDEGTPINTDCREDTILNGDMNGDGAGDGAVIEIRDSSSAGSISAASRVEGFTVTGGASTGGAGMYLAAAGPRLRQLIVTGNTATASAGAYGWGGGISAIGADLDLADSIISGNTASHTTGAAQGGGLWFNGEDTHTLTLDGVTITGNAATATSGGAGQGGGLYVRSAAGLSVQDTDLTYNSVSGGTSTVGGGGAVSQTGGGSWTGGTISNNSSDLFAGGLALSETEALDLSSVTFSDNAAEDHGGGLWLSDGPALMSELVFEDNDSAGTGGAVGIWAGEYGAVDSHAFSGCTFSGNTAAQGGAGIYLMTYPTGATIEATLTITDSTFDGNAVIGDISSGAGGGAITATLYTSNHTLDLSLEDSAFSNNSIEAETVGGTSGHGGAVWFSGDAFHIDGVSFNENSSGNGGGAVWVSMARDEVLVTSSEFASNVATYSGSALTSYGTLSISGSTFTGNDSQDRAGRGDIGGALYLNKRDTTPDLSITNSTFSTNTNAGNGAVFWETADAVEITDTAFSSNTAGYRGGAIYGAASATVRLSGLTVESNRTEGSSAYGANVHLAGSTSVEVSDCTFADNHGAVGSALSIENVESVLLDHLELLDNTTAGGGTVGLGGDSDGTQTVTMSHLAFYGNTTTTGALLLGDSGSDGVIVATLTNAIFAGNTASLHGGAAYVESGGELTVTNAVFLDNEASEGGAIKLAVTATSLTVRNSVFSGNTCTGTSTCGYDVRAEAGTVSITYSHAADHVTGETSRFTGSYGTADLEAGTGNLWDSDPLFTNTSATDPADWDLALATGSPLIDAGDPSSAYDDADGSVCDIGAYGGPGGESW